MSRKGFRRLGWWTILVGTRRVMRSWLLSLAVVCVVIGAAKEAEAKTLNVANNGVDSLTCGDKKSPCRSISKAIANAAAGDDIIVGPGRYGDLNGNGTFELAGGEEKAEVGSGCNCMIRVNKPLTIESRDGAAATVLDAGLAGVDVVLIEPSAGGTVFGKKKKGFTLTLGGNGLDIAGGTVGVRVAGNLATVNGNKGFRVDGSGHVLTGNLASLNNQLGFSISGNGHVLSSNVANANGAGFLISSNSSNGHLLSGNIASANGGKGFIVDGGSGHVLTGNSALGNTDFGIEILVGSSVVITKNNIFGNHGSCNVGNNSGLLNNSGVTINATNNFWGAATGPGGNPADDFCSTELGSITNFAPFATKEFKVKVKILDESPSEALPVESDLSREAKRFWAEEETRVQFVDLQGHLKYDSGWQTSSMLSQLHERLPGLANGVYLYTLRERDQEGREIHREVKKSIIRR